MDRMRRGVLLTLCIMLIASSFLYLLTSVSSYSNSLKDTTSTLSNFEVLSMQRDSVEYGLAQLVSTSSVDFESQGTNLTFIENSSAVTYYSYDLANFKKFIEAYAPINTTIDISEAVNPKFYISPQNIILNHNTNFINLTPENSSISAGNISGYSIQILLNIPTLWINWSELSELPSSNPNAMSLHIALQGSNGTMSAEKYIDKYNPTEFRLTNWNNVSLIEIRFDSPALLTINYSVDMYLKTIVGLNNSASVELGANIVNITMGSDGENLGKVIIYSN